MLKQLNDLEYDPTNASKINFKKETLFHEGKLYNNKDNVIKGFEKGILPFKDGFQ